MIHVMAATGLAGAAMAAPVVGYDAIAVLEEEQHLRVPIIGRQRPAVAEHDRLTFAPVLVVEVDVARVSLTDCDVWHSGSPFCFDGFFESTVAAGCCKAFSRLCSCLPT